MPAPPASRQAAKLRRLFFWLICAGAVLLLTSCWVDVDVEVTVDNDGSGRIVANVLFSQELTDALISRGDGEGAIGIDFADFEANGWEVSPDSESVPRNGEVAQALTLTKPFVSPEHLKTILEDELQLGFADVSLAREVRGSSVDYQLTGSFQQEMLAFDAGGESSGETGADSLQRAPRVTLSVSMPGGEQTSVVLESSRAFEFATDTDDTGSRIWQWIGWAAFSLFAFVILMNLLGYYIERRQRRTTKSDQLLLDLNAAEVPESKDDSKAVEAVAVEEVPPDDKSDAALFEDEVASAEADDEAIDEPDDEVAAADEIAAEAETTVSSEEAVPEEAMPELNSFNLPSGTSAVSCVTEGAERALVIIPDIMGLRPLFEEHALRLARENDWSVCCYELYADNPRYELDQRFAHACDLEDDRVLGDAVAAADALTEGTDMPVGIIGFCMGGMYVNKSVATGRFDRAVSFYGMIEVPEAWKSDTQREPLECIAEGDASKLLAVIAEDDDYTPADEVASLREAGVQIASYPSCDHGFAHDPDREAHRPEEAADAWSKAVAFLKGEE